MFNRFDYILRNFVSDEILRPALCVAHKIGDFVYATNTHMLIKIPAEMCEANYDTDYIPPDFISFFQENWTREGEFTYDQVLPCFENIRISIKKGTKKCPKCEGEGSKTCPECQHEEDCRRCKGTGEIEVSNKLLVRDVDLENTDGDKIYNVQVGKGLYDPLQLELICLAMMIAGAADCKLSHIGNSKSLFEFGAISIVLMQRSRG